MEIYLNIKGSKKNIYVIGVCDDGEDSFFDCDCPISNFSSEICKHRIALLKSDFSNIMDADDEEISLLKEFVAKANVQNELDELNQLQSEFDNISLEQKRLKSSLSQKKKDILNKFYQSYDYEEDGDEDNE